MEAGNRRERRVDRLRRASRLPPGKTLEVLTLGRFPKQLVAEMKELSKDAFLERSARKGRLSFLDLWVGKRMDGG